MSYYPLSRQVNRILPILILVITVTAISSVPQVAASCGDVSNEYDARQYFAPLTIQLDFKQTGNRGADWTSQGLIAGRPRTGQVKIGSDYLTFEAYGNDTYNFWFAAVYETVVAQNVTLTIIEGDRPPAKEHFCMNGQSIYFKWTNVSVVNEPHPLTEAEVAQAVYPQLSIGMLSIARVIGSLTQSIGINTVATLVSIIVSGIVLAAVLSIRKRLSGYG